MNAWQSSQTLFFVTENTVCLWLLLHLPVNETMKALQEKISPFCLAYYFTWAVELENEPTLEIFDNGATCNTSLSTRTLNCSKNIYSTLYKHYISIATAFFLIWGKLLILISDVLHTEASCMTFLTAIYFLMILYIYIYHGGVVGWGNALQTRRLWMWPLMRWLGYFIDSVLPSAPWLWGWLCL